MNIKDTVYITDVEAEILSVFIRRKVFSDETIAATLDILIEKLREGKNEDQRVF